MNILVSISGLSLVLLTTKCYCGANRTNAGILTDIWNSFEILKLEFPLEASRRCSKSMVEWKNGIVSGEPWALQMLDASAKLSPGLLEGNVIFMGALEECWAVRNPKESPNPFQGSYYMLVLSSNRNKAQEKKLVNDIHHVFQFSDELIIKVFVRRFQYDVCIPSTCSKKDLQIILSSVFDEFLSKYGLRVLAHAQVQNQVKYTWGIIFAMSVFAILLLSIAIGTAVDVFYRHNKTNQKDSRYRDILVSFSLLRNSLRLLDKNRSRNALAFLDGIRALSSVMVLMGHVYVLVLKLSLGNYSQYVKTFITPFFTVIDGYLGTSTDTFFFTSGFVLSLCLKNLIQGTTKTISKLQFIALRYYRLTPPYALSILFVILWPLLGSGPRWHVPCSYATMSTFVHCADTWWANLLYVSNQMFVRCEICFLQGWSSAADMQLFLITLFTVIPFIQKPNLVFGVCCFLITFSWIAHGYIAYISNLHPIFITGEILRQSSMNLALFTATSGRFGPYIIGFLTGFVLLKNGKLSYTKRRQLWFSSIGFLCVASIVIESAIFFGNSMLNNAISRAVWFIVRRSVWATGLACIFYACASGIGGFVNEFLSSTKFIVISRLSYMTYLTHIWLYHAYYGTTRGAIYINYIHFAVLTVGLVVCSYFIAFFAHLCFEAPFVSLGHILFSVKREDSKMNETEKPDHKEAENSIKKSS